MEDHDLRLLLSSLIKLKRSGATCTMQVETLKGQARATLTLSPRTPTTTSLESGPPSSSRTGASVPPSSPTPTHLPHTPYVKEAAGSTGAGALRPSGEMPLGGRPG